jgi:hypothetical protein
MAWAIEEVHCGRFAIREVVMIEGAARSIEMHYAYPGLEG